MIQKEEVVFGRAKRTYNHDGNIEFRRLTYKWDELYKWSSKKGKTTISDHIVYLTCENG